MSEGERCAKTRSREKSEFLRGAKSVEVVLLGWSWAEAVPAALPPASAARPATGTVGGGGSGAVKGMLRGSGGYSGCAAGISGCRSSIWPAVAGSNSGTGDLDDDDDGANSCEFLTGGASVWGTGGGGGGGRCDFGKEGVWLFDKVGYCNEVAAFSKESAFFKESSSFKAASGKGGSVDALGTGGAFIIVPVGAGGSGLDPGTGGGGCRLEFSASLVFSTESSFFAS